MKRQCLDEWPVVSFICSYPPVLSSFVSQLDICSYIALQQASPTFFRALKRHMFPSSFDLLWARIERELKLALGQEGGQYVFDYVVKNGGLCGSFLLKTLSRFADLPDVDVMVDLHRRYLTTSVQGLQKSITRHGPPDILLELHANGYELETSTMVGAADMAVIGKVVVDCASKFLRLMVLKRGRGFLEKIRWYNLSICRTVTLPGRRIYVQNVKAITARKIEMDLDWYLDMCHYIEFNRCEEWCETLYTRLVKWEKRGFRATLFRRVEYRNKSEEWTLFWDRVAINIGDDVWQIKQ